MQTRGVVRRQSAQERPGFLGNVSEIRASQVDELFRPIQRLAGGDLTAAMALVQDERERRQHGEQHQPQQARAQAGKDRHFSQPLGRGGGGTGPRCRIHDIFKGY